RSGRRHARRGARRGARARAGRLRRPRHRPCRDAGGARVSRFLPRAAVIVRWSLDELPAVLAELGVERPFLVASPRWSLAVPVLGRWHEVPSHRAEAAPAADSLLAVGGGSAIDTAKNLSA